MAGGSSALGATPQQTFAGLVAAQLLPALIGAVLGIPLGTALFAAVQTGGPSGGSPPAWWLLAMILAMLLTVTGLTAIPPAWASEPPSARSSKPNMPNPARRTIRKAASQRGSLLCPGTSEPPRSR